MKSIKLHKILILALCLLICLVFSSNADLVSADDDAVQFIDTVQEDVAVFLPIMYSGYSSWPPGSLRTVNATYFNSSIVARAMGIFWFGNVMETENYSDVRVGYNDTELVIDLRIIDRQIWYDKSPSIQELTDWDAVTLLLSTSSVPSSQLTSNEFKFVSQLTQDKNFPPRENYQAFYQGQDGKWNLVDLLITTEAKGEWIQGGGPNINNIPDYGWMNRFKVPFESLGYSNPPHNAVWRLAVVLHDRDDEPPNPPIDDKTWPETLNPTQPTTWGGLHFGEISDPQWAVLQSPAALNNVTTIKHGSNGATVSDAHVGGALSCGYELEVWTEWGNMNYENIDPTKINIQNQTLVGDWPCFSKYYIKFPLEDIPKGKIIDSAKLTMYHFGNSGGGNYDPPYASWIQVFTVTEDWIDTKITWNNAPLAFENVAMTRVEPLDEYPGWPGIPIDWNVSKAVDAAYRAGQPLRLALYSADSAMHSGKYFFSSDSNSDGSARPTLTIFWRDP